MNGWRPASGWTRSRSCCRSRPAAPSTARTSRPSSAPPATRSFSADSASRESASSADTLGQVVGQLQDDLAQLVTVGQRRACRRLPHGAGLRCVAHEEYARATRGEQGGGGPDPRPRRRVRPGDDLRQCAEPGPELLEALLAAVGVTGPVGVAQRRLVPLEEPEDLVALHDDRDVAIDEFVSDPRGWRLVPAPGDERVKLA